MVNMDKVPPVPSAQERAALEASIRAKVNCEKAAYNMQWELLEPGVTAEQLEAAARVLQPSHYEDIVAERAIDGLCGYPPCTNAAPLKGQGPKFHVSIDDRRVYDISSLHSFCGRECARRSHAYATSLSTTSLFLREGVAAALAPATAAGAEREAAAAATRQDAAGPVRLPPAGGGPSPPPPPPPPPAADPSSAAAAGSAASAAAWSAATSASPTKVRAFPSAATLGTVFERRSVPPPAPFATSQIWEQMVEGYRPRSGGGGHPVDARRSGAARVLDDAIPAYAFGVMGLNEAEAATKTAAKAAATRAAAKAKTQRAGEGNASARSTAERVGQAGLGTTERTVRMEYG
jgi:hypothetical protein